MEDRSKYELDKQKLLNSLKDFSQCVEKMSFEDMENLEKRVELLDCYSDFIKRNTAYRRHITKKIETYISRVNKIIFQDHQKQ